MQGDRSLDEPKALQARGDRDLDILLADIDIRRYSAGVRTYATSTKGHFAQEYGFTADNQCEFRLGGKLQVGIQFAVLALEREA